MFAESLQVTVLHLFYRADIEEKLSSASANQIIEGENNNKLGTDLVK